MLGAARLARAFPRRMDSHAGGCPALGTGGCTHLPVRARVADGGARPGTPWWYGADLPGRGTASASPPLSPLRQRTPHIGGCPRPLFRRGTRRRTNRTLPAVAAAKVCARAARTHTQYVHATATGGVGALLSFFLSSSSPPLGFFFLSSVRSGAASPPRRRGGARLFLNCTINPCLGHPAASSATSVPRTGAPADCVDSWPQLRPSHPYPAPTAPHIPTCTYKHRRRRGRLPAVCLASPAEPVRRARARTGAHHRRNKVVSTPRRARPDGTPTSHARAVVTAAAWYVCTERGA